MTFSIVPTPPTAGVLAASTPWQMTLTESGFGLLFLLQIATDPALLGSGLMLADIYDTQNGGWQPGYTMGSTFTSGSSSWTVGVLPDTPWTAGSNHHLYVGATDYDPVTTADFTFTIAGGAPSIAGTAANLDWPALLTSTRYAGMGVNTIAWGGGQPPARNGTPPFEAGTMATRRLLAQYQGKPNMTGLIRAIVSQLHDLEVATQTVFQLRGLDTAFGPALDQIGEVLGLDRVGNMDNTYRVALAAMAKAVNASGATAEECRNIVDWCFQGLASARLLPQPPGCAILRAFEVPQDAGMLAGLCMDRASAAGKRVIVQWQRPSYEGTTFGFSDDLSSGTWADWGTDPTSAGLWAEGWDGVQQ